MTRAVLMYSALCLVACASRASLQETEPTIAAPPASHWEPYRPPSDAGPYDQARLSTDLCADGVGTGGRVWWGDLQSPLGPADYVELRLYDQRAIGGWRCRTATDRLACEREFRALPPPRPYAPQFWQLVVERDGHFQVRTNPSALLEELGALDTLPEVALWLRVSGYHLECGDRFRSSGEPRGASWRVYAMWTMADPVDSGVPRTITELRLLEVDPAGQIRILERRPFSY